MVYTLADYLPSDLPLKKAITFFMVPFFINDDADILPSADSIWKRCEISVDRGVLYAHIQNFLLASVRLNKRGELTPIDELQPHDYCIYSLDDNMNLPISAMMNKEQRYAILNIKSGGGKPYISFRFMHSSEDKHLLISPKLVICRNAKVGMVMFAVEMSIHKKSSLADLQILNYRLFKTFKKESSQTTPVYLVPQAEILPSRIEIKSLNQQIAKLQESIDRINKKLESTGISEQQKEQIQADLQRKQEKLQELRASYQEKEEEYIRHRDQKMTENIQKKIQTIDAALCRESQDVFSKDERVERSWIMHDLVQALIQDFVDDKGSPTIERVDPFRLHVFTYVQVEAPETSNLLRRLLIDFSRLLRCQDSDYLPVANSSGKTIMEPMFYNIIIGSTVEGAGILTMLTGRGDDFISQFDTTGLTKSYLWIYLMVFMQRLTLLRMSRLLADSFGHKDKEKDKENDAELDERIKELRDLSRKMIQIKVNTFFTDVSNHSHHNSFYHLCSQNLAIENYQKDVDAKLKMLHDELMEAYQEADKRTDEAAEQRKKKVDVIFAVCAAVFALFSSCYDLLNLLSDDTSRGLGLLPDCMGGWRIIPVVCLFILFVAILYIPAFYYLNKKKT